ncbi:hypothetical protein BGX26_005790, partial [Mortierella sp. AD094]
AVQKVIDRHDILRTAIVWKGLSAPAQVVLHEAKLSITELLLDSSGGSISEQMMNLFDSCQYHLDVSHAPLIQFMIAQDNDGHWLLFQLMHHLIGDHSTLEEMTKEIHLVLQGKLQLLHQPQPFRNLIAYIHSGPSIESHKQFFSKMLSDIDTPSLPYGLSDVYLDGVGVDESHLTLSQELNNKLRGHAKQMG